MKFVDNSVVIEDGKRKIIICQDPLHILKNNIQKNKKQHESGGILIGRENLSNNNLIIEYITKPLLEDKRNGTRFYRKDKGHVRFYNDIYDKYGGIHLYVGEWHTHPEAIPQFSLMDVRNWGKIGKEFGKEKTQIHIIVGYSALSIWEFSFLHKTTRRIATIFWNEVSISEEN